MLTAAEREAVEKRVTDAYPHFFRFYRDTPRDIDARGLPVVDKNPDITFWGHGPLIAKAETNYRGIEQRLMYVYDTATHLAQLSVYDTSSQATYIGYENYAAHKELPVNAPVTVDAVADTLIELIDALDDAHATRNPSIHQRADLTLALRRVENARKRGIITPDVAAGIFEFCDYSANRPAVKRAIRTANEEGPQGANEHSEPVEASSAKA